MTFAELAEVAGAQVTDATYAPEIRRVSAFEQAGADSVVFASSAANLEAAITCGAGAILTSQGTRTCDVRLLRVDDPRYAFALCARALRRPGKSSIHKSAVVDVSATIGDRTQVAAGAVIEASVSIGADCVIGAHAVVCAGTHLGDRVVVKAGAVLGSDGFGFARNAETGEYLQFPQIGTLVIEDDVHIGANTTIDRGALGETRIGAGTKIDNQVHIAHNCRVGRNVILAAQVGIAGTTVVGDGAVLGGQVGLGDHVVIGAGVVLGGSAGVFPHKQLEGAGQVFMGIPAKPLRAYLKQLAKAKQ